MGWYKKAFGEDYMQIYAHRDKQEAQIHVNFAAKVLNLIPGKSVLDLGCGYGRHTVEMATLGLAVYCIDLSDFLIKKAKILSSHYNNSVYPLRGDMRFIPFKRHFDAVLSFFTSFGYFEKEEDNERVVLQVSQVLQTGGYFFLDYLNLPHALATLVSRDRRKVDDKIVTQKRRFNKATFRIEKDISIRTVNEVREYHESVRAFSFIELGSFFHEAGLKCIATYGNYDGSKYSKNSPRLLMIGQKE